MSSFPNSYPGLMPREDLQLQCQTARAPDYYGLGVRLGIYFAWLQAYLANNMIPSEIASAADTNTIFLLALLVAMIRCSSIKMLEQIDGLILMHLSGGTIFGIFSIWGYRTRRYVDDGPKATRFFGGFGTHSRLIVSLAVSIYGLWYWLYAVTGSLVAMGSPGEVNDLVVDPPNSPDCATLYTFMFAKVRADGGIRIFYVFLCICCTIYFGVMLLMSSIAGWARLKKMIDLGKEKRWADSSKLRFATGFTYLELETIFKYLRVLNFLWLVYSVFLVEFTLNFNNVTAVLGGPHDNELHLPSQLLPLLMGAFGFVRACYLLFESWRSPGDIEPSVAEPSPSHPTRTMHIRDIPLAFSPAMARNSIVTSHDPNELDDLQRGRRWPVRYLVAWLPWLSLLPHFQDEPISHEEKRQSGHSGYSRANNKIDFALPPRRETPIGRKPVPEHDDDDRNPLHHGETV